MAGILQILFDDLGYGDFACYGHPFVSTPNIDAIATAGKKFNRFLVTPVCSPTRAMLMTGYPPQHWGMHYVDSPEQGKRYWLPPHTPTVSRRLQRLGWKTAHFGKTHWGSPPQTLHPRKFGYDKFFGVLHGHPNAQFPQHGWSRATDCYFIEDDQPPQLTSGFGDDVCADNLIAWLTEQENAGNDWYAEWWTFTPHEPLGTISLPEMALYPDPTYDENERHYYGAISRIDTRVGEIVSLLSSLGALDTTTIAVGSENGPEVHGAAFPHQAGTSAPWRGWKTSLLMGGICVPWIMRGPGIAAGATDDRFRGGEDWAPTVYEIAGYDTSEIPGGLPGESLLTDAPPTRYICREFHGIKRPQAEPSVPPEEWTCAKADTESRLKLVRTSEDGTGDRLYDIDADPQETTDLSGSESALLAELQGELDAWVAKWADEVGANHDYPPEDPETELEAVTPQPEPIVEQLLVRCVDAADQTAKEALLNKALGYPRQISCSHGFTGTTVSEYAPQDAGTHPTQLQYVCLATGTELKLMIDDPVIAGRLNTAEQTEFFEMCIDAHVAPVA